MGLGLGGVMKGDDSMAAVSGEGLQNNGVELRRNFRCDLRRGRHLRPLYIFEGLLVVRPLEKPRPWPLVQAVSQFLADSARHDDRPGGVPKGPF